MSAALTPLGVRARANNTYARKAWSGEPEGICPGLFFHSLRCHACTLPARPHAAAALLGPLPTTVVGMLVRRLGHHEMGIVRLIALAYIAAADAERTYVWRVTVGEAWPWPSLSFRVPHRCCHRLCNSCDCKICTLPPILKYQNG